jgi:hypothetical protein
LELLKKLIFCPSSSVIAQMELKPNSEVALIYGERNIPLNIALNYEDECILVKIH